MQDAGPTLTGRAVRVRGPLAPQFLARHALSPPDAMPFRAADAKEAALLARMVSNGEIRQAAPGLYYLDLPTCHRVDARRQTKLAGQVMLAAVILAALATLFYRG